MRGSVRLQHCPCLQWLTGSRVKSRGRGCALLCGSGVSGGVHLFSHALVCLCLGRAWGVGPWEDSCPLCVCVCMCVRVQVCVHERGQEMVQYVQCRRKEKCLEPCVQMHVRGHPEPPQACSSVQRWLRVGVCVWVCVCVLGGEPGCEVWLCVCLHESPHWVWGVCLGKDLHVCLPEFLCPGCRACASMASACEHSPVSLGGRSAV